MKRILLATILTLIYQTHNAQSFDESVIKNLQSANIASLGTYGETPVSLATGTADISIPLYELKTIGGNIPVSLSYHTASIKPDQHPGWVGLGWNLCAGGAIYRIVNDECDDLNHSAGTRKHGFFRNDSSNHPLYSYLNDNLWNTEDFVSNIAHNAQMTIDDTEPDEFSFQFLDYSGKFYLDHHGEWKVQCNRHVKVELLEANRAKPFALCLNNYMNLYEEGPTFGGFKITGEDGTEYIFGCTDNSIEYSRSLFWSQYGYWTANAWYLTKIKYSSGKEVTFNYCRESIQAQFFNSLSQYAKKVDSRGWLYSNCSNFNYESYPDLGNNGNIISPVYLTDIEYGDLRIQFYHSESTEKTIATDKLAHAFARHYFEGFPTYTFTEDGAPLTAIESIKWQKLDSITISNHPKSLSKNISLKYNNNNNERLALQSVKLYNDDEYLGKYEFTYNSIDLLPDYLALMNDHWGFYNGITDIFNNSVNTFTNTRNPNEECMMYGMLTKIKYPTGGYSRYVFEPHTYKKTANIIHGMNETVSATNLMAGGARLKEIVRSDTGSEEDEYTYKSYIYSADLNSGISSGILSAPIQYVDTLDITSDHHHLQMIEMRSESVLPVSTSGGTSHIQYSDVIEVNNDGTYSKYHFTNYDNGYRDEACCTMLEADREKFAKFNSKAMERGLLLSKYEFSSSNQLVRGTEYTYHKDSDSNNYVRAVFAKFYNFCNGSADSWYDGQAYKIYTYSMLPETEEETVYESNGSIKTTTRYAYNDFNQLSSKTVYNGNTEIEKEIHSYVGDYTNNNMFAAMTNRNMLFPVETTKYIKGLAVSSSLNTYKENFRTGNYVNDKTYKRTFTPATASPLFYDGAVIPSSYGAAELTYKSYDNFDNITDFCKKDGIDTGIIWDAQGEHPLMVATNAEVNDTNIVVTYPYVNNTVEFYQHSTPPTITFTSGCDNSYFGISVAQRNNTKWKVCGTIDGNQTFCIVDAMDEVPDRSWQGYECSFDTILSAGTHYINITSVEVIGNPNYNGENIANLAYGYQTKQVTAYPPSYQDLFYEDFDITGNSNGGFLGTKCHTGNFNVAFAVNPSRNYFIDYLAWDSATSTWKYHRNDFNGSFSFSGSMKIDNVRVYPKDSQVNSYTFCNGLGMTSKTDGKGITTFYHFDKAGRLNGISDSERGSIERYEYFYNNR